MDEINAANYTFNGLDVHSAFIVQDAIEKRKSSITKNMEGFTDKAFKAVIAELDQLKTDLDRHVSMEIRKQEQRAGKD